MTRGKLVRALARQLREAGYPTHARQLVRRRREELPIEVRDSDGVVLTVRVARPGTLMATLLLAERDGVVVATTERVVRRRPPQGEERPPGSSSVRTVRVPDEHWALLEQHFGTPSKGIRLAITRLLQAEGAL